jgi:hypothetical protein
MCMLPNLDQKRGMSYLERERGERETVCVLERESEREGGDNEGEKEG